MRRSLTGRQRPVVACSQFAWNQPFAGGEPSATLRGRRGQWASLGRSFIFHLILGIPCASRTASWDGRRQGF